MNTTHYTLHTTHYLDISGCYEPHTGSKPPKLRKFLKGDFFNGLEGIADPFVLPEYITLDLNPIPLCFVSRQYLFNTFHVNTEEIPAPALERLIKGRNKHVAKVQGSVSTIVAKQLAGLPIEVHENVLPLGAKIIYR